MKRNFEGDLFEEHRRDRDFRGYRREAEFRGGRCEENLWRDSASFDRYRYDYYAPHCRPDDPERRGGDLDPKCRAVDPRGEDEHRKLDSRRVNPGSGSTPSVHDRIGGNRTEFSGKGKWDDLRDRGPGAEFGCVTCFWCGQECHFQANCTNPPLCFRCKDSSHVAMHCPHTQGSYIQMRGFGFPGQGFYCLKIPEINNL